MVRSGTSPTARPGRSSSDERVLLTRIRIVERTGSTNADLLADQGAEEGDWLVALEQTAGRGRQGRQWLAADGNFYGSTMVDLRAGDPPAPTLALAAGLALIEAVEVAAPDSPLMLKWPNDVLLSGKKLGGILLERAGDRVVIGFGVNLASAPAIADRPTASLSGVMVPQAFAPLLAASFERILQLWRRSNTALLVQAWLPRAHPRGTPITVHVSEDEMASGTFDGLEPDGALRLRTVDGQIEIVHAGDVTISR